MKKASLIRRLLAFLTAAGICLPLAPWRALAAEQEPWSHVDAKYDVYAPVTAPAQGDTVVLYHPESGRALSSQGSDHDKSGEEAVLTGDGYLAFDSDRVGWTVSIDENGLHTFTQGGQALGVLRSGIYLDLKTGAGDPGFLPEAFTEGEGLYRLRSGTVTGDGGFGYLRWYGTKGVFCAHAVTPERASESEFGFRFYKLVRRGQEEEQPGEPSEPVVSVPPTEATQPTEPVQPEGPVGMDEGDYVIWAPEYGKALSGSYGGFYNSGVDVAFRDGVLTGYTNSEIWTVKNLEDGSISISLGGETLAMEDSFSTMTLGGSHAAWILEAAGGGTYYVKNAVREVYIQWYPEKAYWSGLASGAENTCALCFTPARREEIPGTVETVQFSPGGGPLRMEGDSAEITLSTATEDARIYYATSGDGTTFTDYVQYTAPIPVEKGFGSITIRAYGVRDGYQASAPVTRTFTEGDGSGYQLYFGQLHGHTDISDGTGSVEEAFAYASQVAGLDFLAITDHSNSFDHADEGILAEDGREISAQWKRGRDAADAITDEDFVGLYGFEMTWSNGLGHISTFNTPGWQSRTQESYRRSATALQSYYAALAAVPESISQFNHPGTAYGDFEDFAHYSEEADARITLLEVSSGEDAVGTEGYVRAYDYYTRALDKGWHLAPTNSQNNHRGLWGDANTGRTVVLADSLTAEGIYDALGNYRVYATEDQDLHIYYTLNGHTMGAMVEEDQVGAELTAAVKVCDATDPAVGLVEVIVNGGLTAASGYVDAQTGTVALQVPAGYRYYYIRITQPDGDIAVTAPVWVGRMEHAGISCLKTASDLTIVGREQTITAELFNRTASELAVESLVYTDQATGRVLYIDESITSLAAGDTALSSFAHTFAADGVYTITATLNGTLKGVPGTYTRDLEVTVMPRDISGRIIVDGTHFNDYVTGLQAESLGNMADLAAERDIQVHVEKTAITAELLESCDLLIISPPARTSGTGSGGAYPAMTFDADFIALVVDYVKKGGSVILLGQTDARDRDAVFGAEGHAAAQLNNLLKALGSTMEFHDDEAMDEVRNGGRAARLYPETFNLEEPWCADITAGQRYSQDSGCTVNPGRGTWLVRGFDTTCSVDSDGDGSGGIGKGEACFLAVEETGFGGYLFAVGGALLSDAEITAAQEDVWEQPYANRTIYEAILDAIGTGKTVTPIAQVRVSGAEEPGRIFAIEGCVTAGTHNPYTTFPDTIYVQDGTGGIGLFSCDREGLEMGTIVRITGRTANLRGDIQLQILSLEVLDASPNVIAPEQVSNSEAMDYDAYGGRLLQVAGQVTEVVPAADGKGVSLFTLEDEAGDQVKVMIESTIRSGTTGLNTLADIVKTGNTVSAVGLLYLYSDDASGQSGAVLRVRDCDEVLLIQEAPAEPETDKTLLEAALDKTLVLRESDYSQRSWLALYTAWQIAQQVLEDPNATQEEVDTAAAALEAAIRALVPPTGSNPQTADEARPGLCLTVMTLSAAALILLLWKRKRFAQVIGLS